VTLKNMGYGGGLLHSHVQTMPVGSFQQQVTCYHYKDDNNHWTILPTWEADPIDPDGEPRFLQDGDMIRLLHTSTQRNLHSHAIIAPVTKQDYEVAGYGNLTIGDANDYWQVEVVDDAVRGRKQPGQRIHSLTSRLRFRHVNLNCYLKAANVILPQWGFKQVEVSCDKENNPSDAHTYWNIESHWNDKRASLRARLIRWPSRAHLTDRDACPSASPQGRRQALQVALLQRFLAPQHCHDDVQQCARARPRQGGRPRLPAICLAIPLPRPPHVRLGSREHQVLPDRQPRHLVHSSPQRPKRARSHRPRR
jgi:hypothetical protein